MKKKGQMVTTNENYPSVFAIALSYNDDRKILRCLESVLSSDYPNLKVLFLDNGSKFDLTDKINSAYPSVQTIRLKINRGFAGGMNYAMQYLNSQNYSIDYYCLMSNDGYVQSDSLSRLIAVAENNRKIGILGPEILLAGKNDKHDAWLNKAGDNNPGRFTWHDEANVEGKEFVEVGYVRGPCILVRCQMAKMVGLMRAGFYLYSEEVEWQWRGRHNGWTMATCPGSIVYHDHESYVQSFENPVNTYYRTRNEIFFNRIIMKDRPDVYVSCLRNIAGIVRYGIRNSISSRKVSDGFFFIKGVVHGFVKRVPPVDHLEG